MTESRIADARGRAVRYPPRQYGVSLEYQINRARVIGNYTEDKLGLITDAEERFREGDNEFALDVNRYQLVVAYYENKMYREASSALAPLLKKEPNRISYVVTQAEILTEQNEPGQALNFLQRHLEINPNNHALTIAYINALIQARNYAEAANLLETHTAFRNSDHHLWYQLAETWGQAGNVSKVHQARAEYYSLHYDFRNAREQLQFALRIETDNGSGPAELARLKEKVKEVERRQLELNAQQ